MIGKLPLTMFVWIPPVFDSGSAGDPGFAYILMALLALGFITVKLLSRKS